MSNVVEVESIAKRYGETVAVESISLSVGEGEIFGMVGPNGAGKTTTIECIEGLRRPDSGSVRVLGTTHAERGEELKERIGIQLQESNLPPRMKVREALNLFGSFYAKAVEPATLLAQLALEEKAGAFFDNLSGGQKQRLFIALALVNDPDLVFLDELTTGLDPHARRSMWELVETIRDRGKTVFLTTHFMEEAERLCDRVAIVDRGRIVALDSPRALMRDLPGGARVIVTTAGEPDLAALRALPEVESAELESERLTVRGGGQNLTGVVVRQLAESGVEIRDVQSAGPTLEDVFLALTGRPVSPGGSS